MVVISNPVWLLWLSPVTYINPKLSIAIEYA